MSSVPVNSAWSAAKAIDGDTNQNYTANSCAISDISHQNNSAWWKLWLQRLFNVAYLEIYFRFDSCDESRYGVGCGSECSNKCKNRHCDAFNGFCIHGCTDPNALTSDCIVCSDGTYIPSGMCVRCLGRCKNDSPCNKLTGRCVQGCDKNWTGQFCEECVDGFYNRGCSGTCGSCVHGQFCEKINGHCTNGCKANYQQPLCKDCAPGFYGDDCQEECGKCKDVAGCNRTSSLCPNGCKEHWVPPLCKECELYKYGPNCAFDCGHCKDNKPCSMDTGDCPSGCMEGWMGKHCITVIPSADKQGTEKLRFFTLAVVLLDLFTVLIGFVVLLKIYLKR